MREEICISNLFWLCLLKCALCVRYDNVSSLRPTERQLYNYKIENPIPDLLTTSHGEPVDLRDIIQLNSEQFTSLYHLDLNTKFGGERTIERVVHAKGTGAFGYFIVTNDVSKYTSADVFNGVGKKTRLVVRFSSARGSIGASDVDRELKGLSVKFYTKEGNLDMVCLQVPVFSFKDPALFPHFVHVFKRNPRTFIADATAIWDLITLRPDLLQVYLYVQSDLGTPDGYRKMDAFPIHTYELSNKNGDTHYVRFNFRTEQGIANLTTEQAAEIQGTELNYYNRDLFNAIEQHNYPSWRLEMDVMTPEDIRNINYDPFDVTVLWKKGTYNRVQIGRMTLDKTVNNVFSDIEQAAFNPANLVPGIPGPSDNLFKGRRFSYLDTQNYRLRRNHDNIRINRPLYQKTYNRDGFPPVGDNMRDTPHYYPNAFNGPVPVLDSSRPKKKLLVLERPAEFYNSILTNDAQRQRLVNVLVETLSVVRDPVLSRAIELLYMVEKDLGYRVEIGVQAAITQQVC